MNHYPCRYPQAIGTDASSHAAAFDVAHPRFMAGGDEISLPPSRPAKMSWLEIDTSLPSSSGSLRSQHIFYFVPARPSTKRHVRKLTEIPHGHGLRGSKFPTSPRVGGGLVEKALANEKREVDFDVLIGLRGSYDGPCWTNAADVGLT